MPATACGIDDVDHERWAHAMSGTGNDDPFGNVGQFGCFRVAWVIIAGLTMAATIIAALYVGMPGFQQSLENFLRGQQDAADSGPGEGASSYQNIPEVSARLMSAGSTHATVSGDFSIQTDLNLEPHASGVDTNNHASISFFDPGIADGPEVFISLNEPENSVAVAQGSTQVIGTDDQCQWNIQVTPDLVSGSVSCAAAEVSREGEPAGTASINLQFSAQTGDPNAVDGPDPYDDAPTDEPVESGGN
jgi:hypothetical protein